MPRICSPQGVKSACLTGHLLSKLPKSGLQQPSPSSLLSSMRYHAWICSFKPHAPQLYDFNRVLGRSKFTHADFLMLSRVLIVGSSLQQFACMHEYHDIHIYIQESIHTHTHNQMHTPHRYIYVYTLKHTRENIHVDIYTFEYGCLYPRSAQVCMCVCECMFV